MSGQPGQPGEKKDQRRPRGRFHAPDIEQANTAWDDTVEISAELDKRITRKLDKHLMPWLFGLWLLAFIDRSNIGNARIDGLAEDLHQVQRDSPITLESAERRGGRASRSHRRQP